MTDERLDALMESFIARVRAGEEPSITEYIVRHPDLAPEIRELFPTLQQLEAAAPGTDGDEDELPERFGDFRILRELGRGGMGVVYEAEQVSLGNRRVALKVLSRPSHPQGRERFKRESQAVARLLHPNIVQVHAFGEYDNRPYFAMQYLPGKPLNRVIKELREQGKASTSQLSLPGTASEEYFKSVARLGVQVARALAYAHSQGVLHRDIKPSNLIYGAKGDVWITDFGLARVASGEEDLTETGELPGTLAYLPPERFEGLSDRRGDLYGLGLVLYELLTLRPAFAGDDRATVIRRVTDADARPVRRYDPAIPRDLETIVMKALSKDPLDRYNTARGMAEDLGLFARGEPIRARRSRTWERLVKWSRRRPAAAALVIVSFCSLFLISVGLAWFTAKLRDEAREMEILKLAYKAIVQRDDPLEAMLYASKATDRPEVRELLHLLFPGLSERAVLRGHGGEVEGVAFSPLGTMILTWSADGTARTWHVTGRVIAILRRPAPIRRAVFSPYGRLVATAGRGGEVVIWRSDGRLEAVLEGHRRTALALAFSPDGKRIVTGSADGTARVWIASGGPGKELERHGPAVTDVAFSRDGTRILTATRDGTVRMYDATTHKLVRRFVHGDGLLGASLSNPSGRILTYSSGSARVWSPDGELLARYDEAAGIRTAALSPDGELVLRMTSTELWWGREKRDLDRRPAGITRVLRSLFTDRPAIAFSPKKGRVLTAGSHARIWSAAGEEIATLRGHEDTVLAAAFAPDSELLATASTDGTTRLWDLRPAEDTVFRRHDGPVYWAAFSRDGTRILTASLDRKARIWTRSGRLERELSGHTDWVISGDFAASGDVVATGSQDGTVRLWERGRTVKRITLGTPVWTVAFSPEGDRLLLTGGGIGQKGRAWIWNLSDGTHIELPHGAAQWITRCAFSPSGDRVATGDETGRVRVFEVSGALQLEFRAHTDKLVTSVCFSPSGRQLLTTSEDWTARLWTVEGEPLHRFEGHRHWVASGAFSPRGDHVVTSSFDGAARVWKTDGTLVDVLKGHQGWLLRACYSPSGDRILTASLDGTARLWVTDPADLLALIAKRLAGLTPEQRRKYAHLLDD